MVIFHNGMHCSVFVTEIEQSQHNTRIVNKRGIGVVRCVGTISSSKCDSIQFRREDELKVFLICSLFDYSTTTIINRQLWNDSWPFFNV